ncbi:HNH endonuclease family protein [Vibrio parahaemolyticus]|uniref:HNH endonuclease family protein n=1 Tax=Vibrio parahaemolyticus TaxID=670 RepID=UPI00215D029E|nr:HNH endonuclease family protein [Vibrio parahaemolyticus]MCR9712860.1 HNH endonuclease family protein [Vibrio parahaemolyticus]
MNRAFQFLIVALFVNSVPAQALVKMSSSGLCHDENSSYYSRTKNFTPYDTLELCLNAGGKLPAGYSSSDSLSSDYSRDQFGHGWADVDHDGQDTRQEVLIAQNTGNLNYNEHGRVVSGRWISMYSGKIYYNASDLDIDHIVPLSWAWKHGADKWKKDTRKRFANDPRNLVAVGASLNRSKGDKGLDEWLPPANQKQYRLRFQRIVKLYGLN